MVNPPSVAVVAGLVMNLLDATRHIPSFALQAIEWLGQAAVPLSLILVGATIADQIGRRDPNRNGADRVKVIGWACSLRLAVLPAAFLLVAWLLPASLELKRVLVIEAAMPSAVFPVLLARHYGGDPPTALRVVLSTSIIALATIPLWISAGLGILGITTAGG
jgi:predicted permease